MCGCYIIPDMCLDAILALVVDRANTQIPLELLECLLDLGQLDVVGPELCRVLVGEIGAQQVASLAAAYLAQLLAIKRECEGLGGERLIGLGQADVDQRKGASGLFLRRADLQQELVAVRRLGLQRVQAFAQPA